MCYPCSYFVVISRELTNIVVIVDGGGVRCGVFVVRSLVL